MNKLVVKNADYVHFVYLADVVYLHKSKSSTLFALNNRQALVGDAEFSYYEAMLTGHRFVKPWPGFLVNTAHIVEVRTKWPRLLILTNGKRIPLAPHLRRTVEEIIEGRNL